jgi:LysR family transcriptional regulator, regulator of abg operon
MKLTALRALIAAVEEGSLRSAARRLGVSQPALTKLVRELETELATTLLARSTTGVVATAQGKVLYERACAAERELGQAVDQIRQLGGRMVGKIDIGAVPLAVMLLIPETLRTFGREFPEIRLRISEELYIAQLTRLRRGEVDVAIGPLPDGMPLGEFVVEPLMPISMVVVVRKGNPLAKARSLAELAAAPWVFTGASPDAGYARQMFESHGLPPPPAGALVNSTLGLLALVAGGDFVGLMPYQLAMHPMASHYLDVVPTREGPLQLTLGVLVRADAALSPATRHFIAHLHRAAHHLARVA